MKTLRASMPAYGGIHSHVVQDVLACLDKTYQVFFRRVASYPAQERGAATEG